MTLPDPGITHYGSPLESGRQEEKEEGKICEQSPKLAQVQCTDLPGGPEDLLPFQGILELSSAALLAGQT